MKKLPLWVVTDKFPAFYDSESSTAIEQTAKIYGKMNELIEEYNAFVNSFNGVVESFKEDLLNDYTIFKQSVNTQVLDFTNVVELKINEHESTTNEIISAYYTQIERKFNNYNVSLRGVVDGYINSVGSQFEAFKTDVIELHNSFKTEIQGAYLSFTNEIQQTHLSFTNDIIGRVEDWISQVNTSIYNMDSEIEAFKTIMNENYSNFTTGINNTIAHQNQVIADAKGYMQDNIKGNTEEILKRELLSGNLYVTTLYKEGTEELKIVVKDDGTPIIKDYALPQSTDTIRGQQLIEGETYKITHYQSEYGKNILDNQFIKCERFTSCNGGEYVGLYYELLWTDNIGKYRVEIINVDGNIGIRRYVIWERSSGEIVVQNHNATNDIMSIYKFF